MITLITGAPGSGKTLYTVDKLLRALVGTYVDGADDDGNKVLYDRRIYSNINGLLIDHERIDGPWLEDLHENKKIGAVVVFDEVQRVWPNRPTGSKKPAAVEFLETHRHEGIDLIIMTQNPQLLDPAVRALVGRHLHMRRVGSFGAAIIYEWDATSNALNFKNAFTKHPYRYSRTAQKLYVSAKVHTKQTRRLPFAVWMLAAGLLGAAYMWPNLVSRITGKTAAAAPVSQAQKAGAPGVSGAPSPSRVDRLRAVMDRRAFEAPREPGLPHTAPKYDGLTVPVVAPYPAICMTMGNDCRCYTEQTTRLDVPKDRCLTIVDRGYFLDFKQPHQQAANGPQPPAAPRPMLTLPAASRSVTAPQAASSPDVDLIASVRASK